MFKKHKVTLAISLAGILSLSSLTAHAELSSSQDGASDDNIPQLSDTGMEGNSFLQPQRHVLGDHLVGSAPPEVCKMLEAATGTFKAHGRKWSGVHSWKTHARGAISSIAGIAAWASGCGEISKIGIEAMTSMDFTVNNDGTASIWYGDPDSKKLESWVSPQHSKESAGWTRNWKLADPVDVRVVGTYNPETHQKNKFPIIDMGGWTVTQRYDVTAYWLKAADGEMKERGAALSVGHPDSDKQMMIADSSQYWDRVELVADGSNVAFRMLHKIDNEWYAVGKIGLNSHKPGPYTGWYDALPSNGRAYGIYPANTDI